MALLSVGLRLVLFHLSLLLLLLNLLLQPVWDINPWNKVNVWLLVLLHFDQQPDSVLKEQPEVAVLVGFVLCISVSKSIMALDLVSICASSLGQAKNKVIFDNLRFAHTFLANIIFVDVYNAVVLREAVLGVASDDPNVVSTNVQKPIGFNWHTLFFDKLVPFLEVWEDPDWVRPLIADHSTWWVLEVHSHKKPITNRIVVSSNVRLQTAHC